MLAPFLFLPLIWTFNIQDRTAIPKNIKVVVYRVYVTEFELYCNNTDTKEEDDEFIFNDIDDNMLED